MTKELVNRALWVVLFVLQGLVALALVVGLARQSADSQGASKRFAPSSTYAKILADKPELSVDQQRQLLGLCQDLEGMLQTHIRLESAMLAETRNLFVYVLVFIGATLLLQILIAVTTSKRS